MEIKKIILLTIALCGFEYHANAQNKYVIIKISDNKPLICGKRQVTVGDTILTTSELRLGRDQIVRLKDLRTQLPLYPIKGEKYVAKNCTTLKQYLFPRHYGATRGHIETDYLRESIGDELLWVDSMMVTTIYTPDRDGLRYFIMEIEDEQDGGIRFLTGMNNNTSIVFSKEQIFGDKEPYELFFNLRVGNGAVNEYLEKSEIVLEHVKLIPIKE